jgi:hypothetical protein
MNIYKVCVLGNHNKIKEVIVFGITGEGEKDSLFSKEEQEIIDRDKLSVRFSQQQIHKDDSIRIIKNKLLKEYEFQRAYEELYLFSSIRKSYNLEEIFEQVSKKKDYIEGESFIQLCINLGIHTENVTQKPRYFYEDLAEVYEKQESRSVYIFPIGKKWRLQENYMFCANPFLVQPGSLAIEPNSTNPFESFENQVLLNNYGGNFLEDTIFLCFPDDILDYIKEYRLENRRQELFSYYFPLLSIEEINTKEELTKKRENLIKKTKKAISKKALDLYNSINILYDIYHKRMSELAYIDRGISAFYIKLYPDYKVLLPLDTIFKSVHATSQIPFIKYNPGFRRENIYRFYTEKITKYGTKIPFLPPKTIFKLMKEVGKGKQISFAVETENGDIYIDFNSNGSIQIAGSKLKTPLSIEETDQWIQSNVNPILESMNEFLEKSGYKIQTFQSLRQPNLEITNLSYVCSLKITKDIDIKKYKGVFGLLFDILEEDFHKGALFRFKRVENYQEMGTEDIFIAELHGKYQSNMEIVGAIAKEYEMTEEQAILRLTQFIRDHDRGLINQSIRILESPGFLTEMRIQSYDDLFKTEIILDNSTIRPNIEYLDILMIYIDSLLRITQDPKSTSVSSADIKSLVKNSEKIDKDIDKSQFENIIRTTAQVVDSLMFSENMVEDDYDENIAFIPLEEEKENDEDNAGISASFGNLREYESVDIPEEEIENLDANDLMFAEYSDSSSKEDSKEDSKEESNDLMFAEYQEEDSEEEDENEIKGGESKDGEEESEITKKIDGMQLRNRNSNLFLTRLKKYDPVLFLDKDDGKYSSYSKLCASNRSRQPVVLTDEEKKRIDEKYPGGYKHALQYGVKNKNWYICPRYWCLLNNTPLSEEQVKAGACGGKIIPKNADTVPKGHYIYEFNHHIQHQKNGKYIENSPGFLDASSHPDGHCIPCCFKKEWAQLEEKRKQCGLTADGPSKKTTQKKKAKKQQDSDSENEEEDVELLDINDSDEDEESEDSNESDDEEDESKTIQQSKKEKKKDYIYEIRRYPIPPERMGFLPLSVEAFLQTDNSKSIDPNNTKFIKQGSKTLLRFGVENSPTRSFIACLAELYARVNQTPKIPFIDEMCTIISKAVTIDYFLMYHNGSLPAIFKPKEYDLDAIDYRKYEGSTFMKTVDLSIQAQEDFFYDTIASYENFIQYILNPESTIDHTYLWDMVCIPNPLLFINGYNLAILKIREVDMTDDIELLCPTNAYSSTLYDRKKETLILIQHDAFYEPVYFIEYTIYNEIKITHTFIETNSLVKSVHHILTIIRNSIQKYCSPQESLPSIYTFKKNKSAHDIKFILLKYGFTIEKQVINYQGKTIAFMISGHKVSNLYIPCAPSPRITDISTIYMDEPSLWHTYEKTRDQLLEVSKKTKGEILCKPVYKIIEDEMMIGLLTETNQFIMLVEPEYDLVDDGIPSIRDENYIVSDKVLSTSKKEDKKRANTIQRISLETQFYKTFRTTIRILLNQISNKQLKIDILELLDNPRILYKEKLSKVVENIKKICKGYIDFRIFEDDVLMNLKDIVTCFSLSGKQETNKELEYCVLQDNGEYQLILPEKHLVSGVANNILYFNRIADELIRYKRIQQFILYPKTYLNISDIDYQLDENEIIMLESLLTADYFKNLEPYYTVDNSKITYDIANPIKTQKYTSEISAQIQEDFLESAGEEGDQIDEMEIECIQEKRDIIGNISTSIWKQIFPKTAKEIVLHKSPKCSFYPILYIYKKVYGRQLTVENVKVYLLDQYNYFIRLGFENKMLAILRKQGKKEFVDKIRANHYTIQDCIVSEAYFMTNLDIWICANSLKLPIVLFSAVRLKSFEGLDNWIRLYTPEKASSFYFIRASTETDSPGNYLPQYNIVTPELRIKIPNEKEANYIHIEDYFRDI